MFKNPGISEICPKSITDNKPFPAADCDNVAMLRIFYEMVEQCPVSIAVTDSNGIIEYVNPFFKSLTGYTFDEVKGKNLNILKSGEHSVDFYSEMWKTIKSGKTWTGKFINKKKDGTKYIELAKIAPIIEKGEAAHFVGIKTDITEQERLKELLEETNQSLEEKVTRRTENLRKAYLQLKDSRDFLKKTQQVAKMGAWMRDISTKEGYWTEETFNIFGFQHKNTAPSINEILNAAHPDDRAKLKNDIDNLFRVTDNREYSFRIVRPDGEERIVNSIFSYDYDQNGKPYRVNGIYHDQTEKIRIAETIRKHEQLLKSILTSTNAGICVLDKKGVIELVNPEFRKIFGQKENGFEGRLLFDAFPELLNSKNAEMLKAALTASTVLTGSEYSFTLANKKEKKIIISISLPQTESDSFTLITASDVTELTELHTKQKEQEAMLIQQSKMAALGEMIGVITHQWQQPLNAVGMFSQIIEADFKKGELTEESLNEYILGIMGQLEFMSQTVHDFRDFFKPNSTNGIFEVSAALSEITSLVEVHYANSRIEIISETDCLKGIHIYGSKNEFKQVLLNLFANAKDAITEHKSEGGIIKVTASKNNGDILIRIKDNGGGIPNNIKEDIFKSYFSTKGSGGTGIGLYLSKLITETRLKGSISADNEDDGAVFTLKLKIADNQ